jgi:dihydropteroate synthase
LTDPNDTSRRDPGAGVPPSRGAAPSRELPQEGSFAATHGNATQRPQAEDTQTRPFDIRSLDSVAIDADAAAASMGLPLFGRTQIMGVLNVTPDSFSDGGLYENEDAAVRHGVELTRQGADIIDVGGESTRPGAQRVPIEREQERVIPVIRALAEHGIRVSVDTMNAATALAAAQAGAQLINDVSGSLADPGMVDAVIATGLPYVVTHWRGHSTEMDAHANYTHAAREVREELFARVGELVVRGVDPSRLIIDPGLGFAKASAHNWQVLAHLADFEQLGLPVLIGASRKRFVGKLLPAGAPAVSRDVPTAIISALAAQAGVWGVRVHDVAATRLALDVVEAWAAGRSDEPIEGRSGLPSDGRSDDPSDGRSDASTGAAGADRTQSGDASGKIDQ